MHETVDVETLPGPLRLEKLTENLAKINGILDKHGIPPWNPACLGSISDNRPEIDDASLVEVLGPGRVEIELTMLLPGGGQTKVRVRFGGQLVYVFPVLSFNGTEGHQIAMVKRWRVESGGFALELPHGMASLDELSSVDPLDTAVHRIMAKTFGQAAMEAFAAAAVPRLCSFVTKGEWRPAECRVFAAVADKERLAAVTKKSGDGSLVLIPYNNANGLMTKLMQGTGHVADVNTVGLLQTLTQLHKL